MEVWIILYLTNSFWEKLWMTNSNIFSVYGIFDLTWLIFSLAFDSFLVFIKVDNLVIFYFAIITFLQEVRKAFIMCENFFSHMGLTHPPLSHAFITRAADSPLSGEWYDVWTAPKGAFKYITLFWPFATPPPISHPSHVLDDPPPPPFWPMRIHIGTEFASHFSLFCVYGILFGFMIVW